MNIKHIPALTPRAQELRKTMTDQEKKLWYQFLKDYPIRFMKQKVIDRFIVDFYCASAKLVIELDGRQHEDNLWYDNARTDILKKYELSVIRFTNDEIDKRFFSVCESINEEVTNRLPSLPSFLKGGEPPAGGGGSKLRRL